MTAGKVKWFSDAKGFGFIETAEGDVFVHHSVIEGQGFRSLREGQEVELEIEQGPKGPRASKVRPL
jgi:CspA family cold shock protein